MRECAEYPNGVVSERSYDVMDRVAECCGSLGVTEPQELMAKANEAEPLDQMAQTIRGNM